MQTLKLGSKGEDVKTLQLHLNLYPDGIFGKITDEAVRAFQRSRRDPATGRPLTVDGIVGPKTWPLILAMPFASIVEHNGSPDDYILYKTDRRITRIIIHCSATPEGKDYTVEDITRWHKERGYSTIGYHYVIYRDGSIYPGRDINVSGAHCQGYNTGSIGICYIGGLATDGKTAKDTRTDDQKVALRKLVKQLKQLYPKATIHGHNEFSNKACPSFNVSTELS